MPLQYAVFSYNLVDLHVNFELSHSLNISAMFTNRLGNDKYIYFFSRL